MRQRPNSTPTESGGLPKLHELYYPAIHGTATDVFDATLDEIDPAWRDHLNA